MVFEVEDNNYDTTSVGEEGGDEGVWMNGEDEPSDDLMYNGEGKKNGCITRDHVEDSIEESNRNNSRFRSKIINTIMQSTTQDKTIDLSTTSHPQF